MNAFSKHLKFNDPLHQEKWERDNFFLTPFLSAEEVSLLKDALRREVPDTGEEFFLSLWTKDLENRKKVDEILRSVFYPRAKALAGEVKPLIHSFAIKHSGEKSSWHIHQDDTFTNEEQFDSFSIWVALDDTHALNGAMQIAEGSHRFCTLARCPSVPKPFRNLHAIIQREFLRTITMKAGEALVFGHRLIHASGLNVSGQDRLAAVGVYLPTEAPVWFYYRENNPPEQKTEILHLPDDYYLRFPLGEKPEGNEVRKIGETIIPDSAWEESEWRGFFAPESQP